MNKEDFIKVQKLEQKREILQHDINRFERMLFGDFNNTLKEYQYITLGIPEVLYNSFKKSYLDHVKLELIEVEKEFEAL